MQLLEYSPDQFGFACLLLAGEMHFIAFEVAAGYLEYLRLRETTELLF